MKDIKTIAITSVLLIFGLSGNLYAEENQNDESAKGEQTRSDDQSSDQKKKTDEEPECD